MDTLRHHLEHSKIRWSNLEIDLIIREMTSYFQELEVDLSKKVN